MALLIFSRLTRTSRLPDAPFTPVVGVKGLGFRVHRV